MMTIKETIDRELNGNMYSYIELYDVDTEMLIYKGWAWDCPYDKTYIVKDHQIYNINNQVCFTMWVDFTIWEVEDATDEQIKKSEANVIIHGEEEDFFLYTWEEPELI